MLEGLHKIYELDLSNFDFTNGERFDGMFWGCRNLSIIYLNINSEKIENILREIPNNVNISYVLPIY